ncbi:MAG: DNA mismatch repair endonuclease MutL [Thermaurantimonas sp.]
MNRGIIRLLPDHIANQIAAGEVVQRPASVVKELLENSVDAQADQITLLIEDAGKSLIKVIDNGYGISEIDLRLAFERHATSKIINAEDLFRIRTMGFRGEALASIAAVSQIECISKTSDDAIGSKIVLEGGKVKSQTPEACTTGTIISVKNLFFNIPARRSFLKSDTVELRHIYEEFLKIALSHPGKRLRLLNNGHEIYNLLPGNLKQRILSIFGNKVGENLLLIQEHTSIIRINGYLTRPEISKKIKGDQYFFINNRFVKNRYLQHAIMAAYEGLLPSDSFPAFFINLEIDPSEIDVNIHPTKTEVKFKDDRVIYQLLKSAARKTLGINAVAHPIDFEQENSFQLPSDFNGTPKIPTIEVDPEYNPFKSHSTHFPKNTTIQVPAVNIPKNWEELYQIAAMTHPENHRQVEMPTLPDLQVKNSPFADTVEIFQLFQKFILYKKENQVFIIHQQYAHERVLYENMLKSIRNKTILSQQMLIPLRLEFKAHEVEFLQNCRSLLSEFGFDYEWIGTKEIALYGMPIYADASHAEEILRNLCDELSDLTGPEEVVQDNLCRKIAGSSSYKVGQSLNQEAMARLVSELFRLENPAAGIRRKKTFVQIQPSEIDHWFN